MDAQTQQQIIERLSQANNILVTVSKNPSVDQLSACIGLTLLLNRLDKHATAVFSGAVPSVIEFLQPEQTIEKNTDSLRDFIISLDKNKADKLRYKVEDQFVRIYITPYKSSISQNDLVFSEGDFNVEVVVALGVHSQAELDAAITAHGRILHDATVISINAGQGRPAAIGQINAVDPQASSLCEILVNLSDGLGQNLMDNQMATAFLTGIVAETNRFSNQKTTPVVMSVSAKLMAAGANQQLIVGNLEPPEPESFGGGGSSGPKNPTQPPAPAPGVLSISHHPALADTSEVEVPQQEIRIDEQGNIVPPEGQMTQATPLASIRTGQMTMPEQPVDAPFPGPHTFLTAGQQPLNAPLSAETARGMQENEEATSTDPLMAPAQPSNAQMSPMGIPVPEMVTHTEKVIEPPVELARAQVEQAMGSEPFDPANKPLQSMGAQPLGRELHEPPMPVAPQQQTQQAPENEQQQIQSPPPPVPPPLMQAPLQQNQTTQTASASTAQTA